MNNYRRIIEILSVYLNKEAQSIPEPGLNKELEALQHILNCKSVPLDIYMERQKDDNSCFIHAMNAYFQGKYINDDIPNFLNEYTTLIKKHQNLIHQIKQQNGDFSFYGNMPVPQNNLEDENSDPVRNEDLNGYWMIYKSLTCESLIDAITKNNVRELSSPQVLFLLEFHLKQNPDKSLSLHYTPHRFYHRYARSPKPNDKTVSSQRFTELLTAPQHKDAKPIFLCHNEAGRAHAFAAYRFEDSGWALLDSLIGTAKYVPSGDLWTQYENAERASVMLIQDFSRNTQQLI
jgi:hypothetical protein